MAVVYGLLAWLVNRLVENFKVLKDLQPLKILLFVILFVFLAALFKSGHRLWDIKDELSYNYPATVNWRHGDEEGVTALAYPGSRAAATGAIVRASTTFHTGLCRSMEQCLLCHSHASPSARRTR